MWSYLILVSIKNLHYFKGREYVGEYEDPFHQPGAMNLGETYLVTENGNERLGKQKLDLVVF